MECRRQDIFGGNRGFFHIAGVLVGPPDDHASTHATSGVDLRIGTRPMVPACTQGLRIDPGGAAMLAQHQHQGFIQKAALLQVQDE